MFESFKASPVWKYITLQAVGQPEEGVYTVDANTIPSDPQGRKETDIDRLLGNHQFQGSLCDALGNNAATTAIPCLKSGYEHGRNSNGNKPGGTVPGYLRNHYQRYFPELQRHCPEVVMPVAEQAANFRSFEQAFYGCAALTKIDLRGCTGLNQTAAAFYACSTLENVVLPSNFTFATETFRPLRGAGKNRLVGIRRNRGSRFQDQFHSSAGKELTIVVPEAAFDSFSTADTWKSFNIVKASQSSVEEIESVPADSGCRAVYNFSGRHADHSCSGQGIDTLPAGLYIVAAARCS